MNCEMNQPKLSGSAPAPGAANDALVVGIGRAATFMFGARARRTTREARALPKIK